MHWSRYNFLFQSEPFGHFLYNSMSNQLLQLDQHYYHVLEEMKNSSPSTLEDTNFMSFLRDCKILLKDGEEEQFLLTKQYQRLELCLNQNRLVLFLCPTLACNFRCPYCYENSQKNKSVMSSETIEQLISFIKSNKDLKNLKVIWYGGEPLLNFPIICQITDKIKNLHVDFEEAGIITNGYLLDDKKISLLNQLNINFIQITLDGPQEIHDKRRVLPGGQPTFEHILKNVESLMDSPYSGKCIIRVNVDKNNLHDFFQLRNRLLEQFKGKNLFMYAGYTDSSFNQSKDNDCMLSTDDWSKFSFDQFYKGDLKPLGSFHPLQKNSCLCIATTNYGFVVGPKGELYKCTTNVGDQSMVIGNIHGEKAITNNHLQAQYCIGIDPYNDPECKECNVFPICGGGCAHKRLIKQAAQREIDYCSPYKNNLLKHLETYIDIYYSRKVAEDLLNLGSCKKVKGYEIISPKKINSPNLL